MSSVFASLGRLSNPAPFPSLLSALIATLVPLESALDSRSIRARACDASKFAAEFAAEFTAEPRDWQERPPTQAQPERL
jgi:hypothetical protein